MNLVLNCYSGALLLVITVVIGSCGGGKVPQNDNIGKGVYEEYCVTCHGSDGKLALNDAADLTQSIKTKEESVWQVRNGIGMMPPYGSILTDEQIDSVADYVLSLRL